MHKEANWHKYWENHVGVLYNNKRFLLLLNHYVPTCLCHSVLLGMTEKREYTVSRFSWDFLNIPYPKLHNVALNFVVVPLLTYSFLKIKLIEIQDDILVLECYRVNDITYIYSVAMQRYKFYLWVSIKYQYTCISQHVKIKLVSQVKSFVHGTPTWRRWRHVKTKNSIVI
jgi:hypothetical protein